MALDFPSSGLTVGQLFPASATPGVPQWMWDGAAWVTPIGQASQMGAAKIQRFTASGTYTPTAGMMYCVIEAVGGGGGGGGAAGGSATGYTGSGGGSGSYSKRIATSVQIGASQTVTIGSGGAGGVGNASGSAGTGSSVGGLCTTNGGLGGAAGNGGVVPAAGAGGAAGAGDVAFAGNPGQVGGYNSVNAGNIFGAGGGSSMLGPGAVGIGCAGTNIANGQAAPANSGGGGGGAASNNSASTPTGGAGGTGLVIITEYGNWLAPTAVVRGLLHGMTLSTAGSSTTFTVQPGIACDSTFTDMMTLTAAMNKNTGGFAPGSGNGSLDTGTIATTTWYHAFVIKNQTTGAVDVLVSLSATNPTMPSGFSLFRRIGSLRCDSSGNWRGFVQVGDDFLWTTPNIDFSAAAGNSASRQAITLTVPPGVNVFAQFCLIASTGASQNLYATSLDQADTVASSAGGGFQVGTTAANDRGVGIAIIRTDLSGRIGMRSSGTVSYTVITQGWTDRRGRDF
jgi:hypothetical protein